VSQKSEIKDSLNSNIRLLTFKSILKPFNNILKTVIIKGETVRNSTYKVTSDYNSDIIVINIKEVSSKTSDLRLYKYIRLI